MEAGFGDVGIGALFGLYDWRYELLAMLQHARHLETVFGVGPHTISVPRIEPAVGSQVSGRPPYAVTDQDFLKIVAILRIAVPYTGIIMSTRESAQLRGQTFQLGVSQISAGSRTDPGGYAVDQTQDDKGQFQLGDHRTLDEVVRDVVKMGFLPSFCTGCYRKGRTGRDFMDLAKPGEIKKHCDPNGLSTFQEYLIDFASEKTRLDGEKLINNRIGAMAPEIQKRCKKIVDTVRSGKRDVFV
jgi:2-iminoacetate synthase